MIDLTGQSREYGGCYGVYFNLENGRGVKVLGLSREGNPTGWPTPEAVKSQTSLWSEAKKEFDLLRAAHVTKRVPRAYEVTIIKYGNGFFPGIVMEHIDGERACEDKRLKDYDHFDVVRRRLERHMKAHGFRMQDIHSENVLVQKRGAVRRYVVIDFSPGLVTFQPKKKKAKKRSK